MGEAATTPFRRQVLRDEVRRLERLSGNIQALLCSLRAAIEVENAVADEVELLRVAHPSICNGLSPAGIAQPRPAPRRETCRQLLLELHERSPAALTPPEQRRALADAGFAFTRQAIHAASLKLVAAGKLERRRRESSRAQWEYSIVRSRATR